ncbi:helix-turn-helix domain-containing protein [Variovorax sp. HW608]|uniref:helix-turn-helix domain-containing protein n=1 Tax=Variovorax sp. HW608 TaxID=1034889 RepID=UPI000B5AC493|nr:LysR family transcriptional regulator [Variovorax sp. HW608]
MSRPNATVNATADVELLRVFSTLMDERSLARTATRLGRSRDAVDTALRHLRRIFGDPLLLKDGPRMAPTERALALEASLRLVFAPPAQQQPPPARKRRARWRT